ncbi:dipeptidase PepE [Cognaticolwellia aestuarii]|uniref:dipeptidase PepE n=1 Tax=Cognaticolwellia aestuarii TaxID=329993 RepID=UPI001F33B94A|nr:dipeptidase PepE [Cognaticolwellia aestuarii]
MSIEKANLLLLSSSRVGDTKYLQHALPLIKAKLDGVTELLFIPYAGVTVNYDDYTAMVQSALIDSGITVKGIHQFDDPIDAINTANAIAVGGGNTFHLLHQLYQNNLISAIQDKVAQGVPYIGWSAGSNVAGLSIRTTNDMPIIEPKSFDALQLVSFQLNPHYTDHNPPGHNGETREQRLAEFMVLNETTPIVAIVEGTGLDIKDNTMALVSGLSDTDKNADGFLFKGNNKSVISTDTNLDSLLK